MRCFAFWAVGIGILSLSRGALACATVLVDGDEPVRISGETALIVWDKQKGVEHFIRRASFESKSRDFGFLVPTPSRPTLVSADEAMFTTLQTATLPKHETRNQWNFSFMPWIFAFGKLEDTEEDLSLSNSAAASLDEEVEVLEDKRVGSYQAAILSACDAGALQKWLKTNDYATTPALKDWLEPYTRSGWIITAFKIAKDADSPGARAEAVRLSFSTKRPFYPYREPATARSSGGKSRNLRVYFVGDERVAGEIEAPNAPKWPGKVAWSDAMESETLGQFSGQFQTKNPLPTRMTVFDDHSSPRPGVGELYFAADKNQNSITPPPIIHWKERTIWIPADVLAVLALSFSVLRTKSRRRSITDSSGNVAL